MMTSFSRSLLLVVFLLGGAFLFWRWPAIAVESATAVPPPVQNEQLHAGPMETAVFAGGCFWGVQGVYQHVAGVAKAESGYTGGDQATANYETVSTGTTGHAEAVEITYDPSKITYGQLLQIYFSVVADPTELNYQGPDHGSQYRSTIFVQNQEQRQIAAAYVAQLDSAKAYPKPIVTTIEPLKGFYPAEAHHQDFLTLNPSYPYIARNDIPKVEGLQRLFPAEYRAEPTQVLTH